MNNYNIVKTELFEIWYTKQTARIQLQIDGRLQRISDKSHFGHVKKLGQYTSELKFNNGNRIYYTIKKDKIIVLLIAGNKNTQGKDITKAQKIARLIHEEN